jgi:uncharacterized protein YggE
MFIENEEKIRNSLRPLAIKDAKKKAHQLASELGIDLDKIISFRESSDPISYYERESLNLSPSLMSKKSITMPTINTGSKKIIKTVSITFQIN